VEKNGMLRVGDEIVLLNGQTIVGWRTRSVAALMKQSGDPLTFTVKLPVCPHGTAGAWPLPNSTSHHPCAACRRRNTIVGFRS
jgi:hypothetical protein